MRNDRAYVSRWKQGSSYASNYPLSTKTGRERVVGDPSPLGMAVYMATTRNQAGGRDRLVLL